ncbi:MAG: hypothetical protein ACE5KM_07140 [Planctomycetaceae bacterium]
MNVNGKLQKNGGNVASYFCTPDARVIHAVGKPVSGKRLLKEARWAVDTYNAVREQAPKSRQTRSRLMQQAHLAELHTTLRDFVWQYRRELPRAREEFVNALQSIAERRYERTYDRRYREPVVPVELAARRRAAQHFSGDKAHQILAAEPLGSFLQVSRRLFEELTGELYARRRSRVYSAASGLKIAKQRDMPLLLVFHRGRGEYQDEYDEPTKQLLRVLAQKPVALPLKSFIVVVLPLRELAALSNLAKLPAYEVPRNSTTTLVLADPDGSQSAVVDGSSTPQQLAARLWPMVARSVARRAAKTSSRGKHSEALRALRKIARAPIGETMRTAVHRQLAVVRFELARSWAKAGKTNDAVRQFRLVVDNSPDDELRRRAQGGIAELQ